MLATEYLWMSTGECITVCGLLSTCMPHFALTFELSALLHAKQAFYLTLRQPCLLSITSHNPSIILIVYFVNYVTLMISQAVKSCTIAWLPAIKKPMYCPFKFTSSLSTEIMCYTMMCTSFRLWHQYSKIIH